MVLKHTLPKTSNLFFSQKPLNSWRSYQANMLLNRNETIRHESTENKHGQVLRMLNTDHLAVGESVIEFGTCNERLLDHAKVPGQIFGQINPRGCFGYGRGVVLCERLVRRCKVIYRYK